jgi:hypothetical protein
MELLRLKGSSLVRFVTTTQGWATLARNHICVPDQWPFMLVELLIGADGTILMSTAVGIPKTSLNAFHSQGLYYYALPDLPDAIFNAIIAHFKNVYRELFKRVDSITSHSSRPPLLLIK